jgi:DNA recombination protein RmuC
LGCFFYVYGKYIFMEIGLLIIGLVLGIALGFLLGKLRKPDQAELEGLRQQVQELDKANGILEDRNGILATQFQKTETELRAERQNLQQANERLARAEEAFKKQRESLDDQKKHIEEVQKRFTMEFENIAAKLLEEKSLKFTEHNRNQLDTILGPLKEKLKDFESKVEQTYKTEAAERNMLKGEIGKLVELNQVIMQEANNLTKALKGDSKLQGNWGELVLERILESSGLEKDREFKMQVSTKDEEGRQFRPDAVVFLPDNKHLIIDSKVSLTAYEQLVRAESNEDKDRLTREHLLSLRSHIQNLAGKDYPSLTGLNSPDFTLLFVPIEASFGMAVQADAELFSYAWDRRIVIVSPSTLLATLRTIASLWKQDKQNKNALRIAEESGRLYDKFADFVKEMETLGNRLRQAQESYDTSMNRLSTGNGNLIGRAEKLRELGAKTSKTLSRTGEEEEGIV